LFQEPGSEKFKKKEPLAYFEKTVPRTDVDQMLCFQTKNPNWVKFGGPWIGKC
jgi:hypothetical protein